MLRDVERLIEWEWTFGDAVGESRAFDQFHDQRCHTVALLQAVDDRDVRMVQGREDFCFALEAGQSIDIGRGFGENLDGNSALQIRVDRAVDLAHTAHANLRGNFIGAEASSGS
jgi:hypothetical protein